MSFEMFDITNLADPKSYHSTHLDVVFVSEDRVDLAYRGITDGRVSTQVFQLTRANRNVSDVADRPDTPRRAAA